MRCLLFIGFIEKNLREMSSKTPVSVLQEKCVRNGTVPIYNLIHDGVGTHDCTFTFMVQVGESSATGSGRSKKEAKHEAARALLEKLNTGRALTDAAYQEHNPEEIPEKMLSPHRKKVNVNAVGHLQELLGANNLPAADYILTCDEGPPHAKIFTITCTVSKLQETGTASTKKQAKHIAANKMIALLKESMGGSLKEPCFMNADESAKLGEEAIARYQELAANGYKKGAPSQLLCDLHVSLCGETSPFLEDLREGNENASKYTLQEKYDLLLKELGFQAEVTKAPSKDGMTVLLVTLSTTPEMVLFGFGEDEQSAYNSMYTQVIKFLIEMTK